MKKLILLVALFITVHFSTKAMDASVTYATFTTTDQPYMEMYLFLLGSSIQQQMSPDSMYSANVEIVVLFKQEDKIVKYDKYALNTPWNANKINIYDTRRYGLDNGTYAMEVTIKDVNNPANFSVHKSDIIINYVGDQLLQSDIQLLSNAKPDKSDNPSVKNGVYMEALPFNFYNKQLSTLIFYNEIYNSDKSIGEDYLVRYSIEKVYGNETTETVMIANKKRKPKAIDVLLLQMDISKLPSGNFNLLVEVRNRGGALLSEKKIFFQRSNPYLDLELAQTAPLQDEFVSKLTKEELRYSLKALTPLVREADVEVLNYLLDTEDDLEAQRRYLFTFWAIESPTETEKTYKQFMQVAKYADQQFNSGFGYGFETDRGYIFMKYGKPNDIRTVETETGAPPYEIWVYEQSRRTNEGRIKFLFYNPSLSPGNFQLLHSTARQEVNNPQWELELYRDAPNELDGSDFVSGTTMVDNFNRQARRLFEDM